MPRNDRRLAAIFVEVRSGLSPDRQYSFTDLLGCCRRHDVRFGYSTLQGILRRSIQSGEILRPHRDTYLVPNAQGGTRVALPLPSPVSDTPERTRLFVIEDGISHLAAEHALMDEKLDRLISMLHEHVEVRHD